MLGRAHVYNRGQLGVRCARKESSSTSGPYACVLNIPKQGIAWRRRPGKTRHGRRMQRCVACAAARTAKRQLAHWRARAYKARVDASRGPVQGHAPRLTPSNAARSPSRQPLKTQHGLGRRICGVFSGPHWR
ncbi:hypothetical protein LG3211_2369 [Lysobacter gummosus]|nr:hypothetical protein LG3211_2369 [Lysobacter gummosus]